MTRDTLRAELAQGGRLRLIGAHDGLSAVLAERLGFEGIWASGLAISTSHGLPDEGLLTMTEFHDAAVRMRRASTLPIVADVDSGFGDLPVIRRMIRLYEDAGIDAVSIEDKQCPKRNSFQDGNTLEPRANAARKIEAAKAAQRDDSFMVVARQESLIAGAGMDDAVERARLYREAGADALLIHSRAPTSEQVRTYCARLRDVDVKLPVFAIPTTYYRSTAKELWSHGVSVAIYANQLVRASVRAMMDVLQQLATVDSTSEMEDRITSLDDLFSLVGMDSPATHP
jgi:phosphoenolpyruvate phosphomutase